MLQGIRELKALGGISNTLEKYFVIHKDYVNKEYQKRKTSIALGSSNTLFSGITQVIFLLIACNEIMNGRLSLGMYYAFNIYANRFSNSFSVFVNMGVELQVVSVAAERVIGYYQEEENESKSRVSIKNIQSIKVNNVCFGYDSTVSVLQDINVEFNRNSLYVIVGSNGCGKSTLLDLLMNFYSPLEGKILLNDIDINQIKEECLFSKIAYIRQKPFFFNASIIDNMKIIDSEISIDKIKKVCDIVRLHEFIEQLPQGYDTIMGDAGSHFSGGQIHRLALARSLIINAEVYILDEITADMDGENEKIMMDILNQIVYDGKLVIMVSHRLSTIVRAKKIMVMDGGKIVASGTHDKLIMECDKYKRLYGSEWESYKEKLIYNKK